MSEKVSIEKIDFKGWKNSYRMTDGEVELVVTGDIGPRIMRYAFVGGQNLFHEIPSQLGKSGESTWQNRGGHRLWVAPEVAPPSLVTYAPDNFPVDIKLRRGSIVATAPVEPGSGLEKRIAVKMAPDGGVEVLHTITNRNPWTIELAAWGLTVLAPGGVGITGLPPRGTHPEMLAPTNPLVIWAIHRSQRASVGSSRGSTFCCVRTRRRALRRRSDRLTARRLARTCWVKSCS